MVRLLTLSVAMALPLAADGQTTQSASFPAPDYAFTNITKLLKQAERGDAAAQTEYGRRLLMGVQTRVDPAAAMSWFGKAAAAGSGDALFELYVCCRDGTGEPKNTEKADKLLLESAKAMHPRALIELAQRDTLEDANPAKLETALNILARFAREGEPAAQLALGKAMARGLKVKGSDFNFLQLLAKASASNDLRVAHTAARTFRDGEGMLRPDPQRAKLLLARLAERSMRAAAVDLARMAPDSYRNIVKEPSDERLAKETELIGDSVLVDGRLGRVGDSEWVIDTGERKPSVRIIPDTTDRKDVQAGRYIRVWGIVEDLGVVRGLVVSVPEPKYSRTYELTTPRILKGTNREKFVVSGELRNVGKQTIRQASVEIHVYQPDTDKDQTKKLTIKDLAPGESKPLIASFEPTSVQEINNVTPVRAEVNVIVEEW